MGLFDESAFDKTDASSGDQTPSEYIAPGKHKFEVLKHKYIEDSDTFVAELDVLESDVHTVGDVVSFIVNGSKVPFKGAAEKNRAEIKRYVAAVLGVEADQVTSKMVKGTCTEAGNAEVAGRKVDCKAWQNKTNTYTNKKFTTAD